MTISSESSTSATNAARGAGTMRALVYHGDGKMSWDEVPLPVVQEATDIIVEIDAVTICGTDLHILAGDVPEVAAGRILGHEAVGTVVAAGSAVSTRNVGDRVLVSCITACGNCEFCRTGRYGLCQGGGGWVLGHTIDGTQAEYARVPFADRSTYHIPPGVSDEEALMLADIGPTGYEVGVRNGRVQPGDTVVVVGAGPIGLSAVQGARLFSPSAVIAIDRTPARLDAARRFGADGTVNADDDPIAQVHDLTGGRGADVVIEAVGTPATFELCTRLVRPAGRVANVGVHGKPVLLHLEQLWPQDITITTGLVDTSSTPLLLRLLQQHQLATADFVTHRFGIHEFTDAYDVFSRSGDTHALKVVLAR